MFFDVCCDLLRVTIFLVCLTAESAPELTRKQAVDYLEKYGYLRHPQWVDDHKVQSLTDMKSAITNFQHFAGLRQTGVLDKETLAMMSVSRCGLPDDVHVNTRRMKRYVIAGEPWRTKYLTYYFRNFTRHLSPSLVKRVAKKAVQFWSNASSLVISETFSPSSAYLRFQYSVGHHNDHFPFDGPGGVLAHAFYPDAGYIAGDLHLDDDETWTDGVATGTNLLQVMTHELGHALGLGHSGQWDSVMRPFYAGYNPDFSLGPDDIAGIRHLYGVDNILSTRRRRVTPLVTTSAAARSSTTTNSPQVTELCQNATVDAFTVVNQTTYVFIGRKYVVLKNTSNGWRVQSGYPRSLTVDWPGINADRIDAALYLDATSTDSAQLFIFHGERYWRYSGWPSRQPDAGYPRNIRRGFIGIPDNIDAAFVWGGNSHVYFIKGNQYFGYTRHRGVDRGYPQPLSLWKGLPENQRIDAAFQAADGKTYFFTGQSFHRFNDIAYKVENTEPLSTANYWFGCS